MISTSRSVKLACVLLAASAHAALAVALLATAPVEMEGAPGSSDVQLGSSFADMAAGVMSAETVENAIDPKTTATPLEAEQPIQTEQAEPTEVAEPDAAEPVRPQPVTLSPQTPPLAAAATPLTPLAADGVQPSQAPPSPETAQPVVPESIPAETPDEEVSETAVARSVRPKVRSQKVEQVARKEAEAERARQRVAAKKAETQKKAAPQRGNAQENARAGATTGTRTATSKSSGSGGAKATTTGNAAASNYPGLVMSCVSRSGRPNVRGRGTARVSFSVDANGRLTNVGLAAASGSAALDRAAVDLVRRVRGCPPPPPGAKRSFSIGISAR